MNNPLVSVIIPAYNVENLVRESIMSIINQTYKNLEIIIIEDCSTDCTFSILEKINDDRIILLQNKKNLGVALTLNKGLEIAKGKYIARHDSDDISHLKRIEIQVKYLEQNSGVIVLGSAYNEVYTNRILQKKIVQNSNLWTIINCPVHHPGTMFRTEFVKCNNIKYEYIAEDYVLWNRIFIANNYHPNTFMNLDEVLFDYKISDGQLTNSNGDSLRLFKRKALLYYFKELALKHGCEVLFPQKIGFDFILDLSQKIEKLEYKGYSKKDINHFHSWLIWILLNHYNPDKNILGALKIYQKYPVFGYLGYLKLFKKYYFDKSEMLVNDLVIKY